MLVVNTVIGILKLQDKNTALQKKKMKLKEKLQHK